MDRAAVIDGLLYLFGKNSPSWFLYPDDWVGVHKLLDKTPLALGLVILGIFWLVVIGFLVFKLAEYQERKQREAEEKYKRQHDSQ
jgi:heme/copper-type cytochrome/quinol oxidase subunit 2